MAVRYLGTNSPDGTVLGKSTGEKVGFYGVSPLVQPADSNQASISVSTSTGPVTALANQLRSDLVNLGLIKGSS